jgi:hypothetical protein
VSKMLPPFEGQPGDNIGLQIVGTTHLFAADGSRVATTTATLSATPAPASVATDASTATP